MAAAAVVSFPQSFLQRPEDRLFMAALSSTGVDSELAELMLYRVWRDFGSGGSDRRALSPDVGLAHDPQVKLLADSAGYPGSPGSFIQYGIHSGFFALEGVEEGKPVLVCKDFFPINSSWSVSGKSIQKKGAYTRARNRQAEEAEAEAKKQLEVWERTAPPDLSGMDAEQRRNGIIFIHRLGRALDLKLPPDAELRAGPLAAAAAIVGNTPVKSLDDTLLWLLSKAKDASATIPRNLKDLLAAWPSLVDQAGREMM